MVRGVTPELLFGTNSAAHQRPSDNRRTVHTSAESKAGETAHRGWSESLTIHSRESNLQMNGQPKIHLNQDSLVNLFDELQPVFGGRVAKFVVAFRINGSIDSLEESLDVEEDPEEIRIAAERRAEAQQQDDPRGHGSRSSRPQNLTREGLDLSRLPAFRIASLFDLFGTAVQINIDGDDSILESPWTADPGIIHSELPRLSAKLTTFEGTTIEGRINVNQAPHEILLGLPGMTRDLANVIIAAQRNTAAELLAGRQPQRTTVAWLLYDGLVDLKQLRRLAPYITTGGDVFRVHAIGFFEGSAPTAHVEAVVDAAQWPPQITSRRDLPPIGFRNMALLKKGSVDFASQGKRY